MKYDYNYLETATNSIDIETPAQCCIQLQNIIGEYYFLVIQTKLGVTSVLEYGPIIPDLDKLPNKLSYTYQQFDCDTRKIDRIITTFLSNKIAIKDDGATIITVDEVKQMIKNPINYFS